jgi:chromosome segregation ATPase
VYRTPEHRPLHVGLRLPPAVIARLREEALQHECSLTLAILTAIETSWTQADTSTQLAQLRQQLAHVERQYATLQRRSARLTKERRTQAAQEKRERARLVAELAQAEAQVRGMHERLAIFTADHPDLAEENARRYAKVHREERHRRLNEQAQRFAARAGQGETPHVSKRDIIRIAHPDRWSQGQPADQLAHEIMVMLNT